MKGSIVVLSLLGVLMALLLFTFFPNYIPRLHLNQEGLHALSHKANKEIRDGTLARTIIEGQGKKRAEAMRAGAAGRPLNGSSAPRFKKAPGVDNN